MFSIWGWIFLCLFSLFVHKFITVPIFYWRKRKVPHERTIPFFGCFLPLLLRQKSVYDIIIDLYTRHKHHRYCGVYQMTTANLMINDLELIKRITVKDFEHFVDHQSTMPSSDVLFSRNLFILKGDAWRQLRPQLSPAFTSSKMKFMYGLMLQCSRQLCAHYDRLLRDANVSIDVELKDLFTRYANDVIATCAFGLECDSLSEPTNQFYMMGKDATNFEGLRAVRVLLANFAPAIANFLRLSVISDKVNDFFIGMIRDTIAHREQQQVVRPDIIHLLLEARKGRTNRVDELDACEPTKGFAVVEETDWGGAQQSRAEFTDIDIAAQAFIFFFAGFETTSANLSFTATELAINVDVQEKLRAEIDAVMDACNDQPSYEDILKMQYLDMVVSESLRKWPPLPSIDRQCTKDFLIPKVHEHETDYVIKKGEFTVLAVIGIHRDPQYFPDPERFDPERFSNENKHKIVPYSYMPFGIGPRACIGSRFALLEAKILLVHLLRRFEFVVGEQTSVPLKLSAKTFRAQPDNGFWVGMKKR